VHCQADEAAIKRNTDALRELSLIEASCATVVVACERYNTAARFMKWDRHFIAKHDRCCALAGTEDTAIRRAERLVDEKGKVLMIDELSIIRSINDHDGRQYVLGICCGTLSEVVVAFENAALRDTWVSMLKVHMLVRLLYPTAAHATHVTLLVYINSLRG